MITLHDHHKDGPSFFDSVPCTIEHDGLIYTITLRYGWNLEKLP